MNNLILNEEDKKIILEIFKDYLEVNGLEPVDLKKAVLDVYLKLGG